MIAIKRRAVILLVLALVGTLALVLHQQRQILRVESILGTYWSNDFALVFSRLVTLQGALDRLAAGEEIEWLEAEQLDRELSGMTLHLNNTLGDARGLLPDVPRVPHLIGYLDHVREQVISTGAAHSWWTTAGERRWQSWRQRRQKPASCPGDRGMRPAFIYLDSASRARRKASRQASFSCGWPSLS